MIEGEVDSEGIAERETGGEIETLAVAEAVRDIEPEGNGDAPKLKLPVTEGDSESVADSE